MSTLLRRRMMMAMEMEEDEVREWKKLERRVIEEDTSSISFNIPDAQEVMVVFYGRENNADDTKSNANGSDSININGVRVSNSYVTYIRPSGTYFYTFIYAKVINGYLDGRVNPKGNQNVFSFSNTIENIDSIHLIGIASNNYFKEGSWIEIYYR